jgi:hypothetical protein
MKPFMSECRSVPIGKNTLSSEGSADFYSIVETTWILLYYKDTPLVGFNPTSHCVYSSNSGNTMLAQSCLSFASANRHIIFLHSR